MKQFVITDGMDDAGVARWLAERLAARFAGSDEPVVIAMPGGNTPFPIIAELLRLALPWRRLTVWPTDDRAVPEDHPASNTGALRAAFAGSGARIISLHETAAVPRFALAWVGLGADGHVASLFASSGPRPDDPRSVVRLTPDPLPPEAPFARISLTIPALLNSGELLVVARGEEKRAVLEGACDGGGDLPIARLLGAATQPVTVFA
ncbi:6-phosphogluconolactonase [Qipengyuania sediminis]|uniref:6-phosphogluconolactonase n=1 Tax=Qipengyuania sediminis TaxID=1532023 RepID=UPI001F0E0F78|nr:6-phosphogluconolactonase [Qipengyuania sediminis]